VTEAVAAAFQEAAEESQKKRHTEVTESHLLKALFSDPKGYFSTFATSVQLNPKELIELLEKTIKKTPTYEGAVKEPTLSLSSQSVLQEAQAIAKKWNDTYIALDHLLLAFWSKGKEPFANWKNKARLFVQDVEKKIKEIRGDMHMDSPT